MSLHIRPVTPADEPALRALFEATPPEDIRLRFFRSIRHFSHELLAPQVHADDAQHAGLVALVGSQVAGAAMLVATGAGKAEFAILVARAHGHHGLGRQLLEGLLACARERGIGCVYGLVLRENQTMLELAHEMGAQVTPDVDEPGCLRVAWDLRRAVAAAA